MADRFSVSVGAGSLREESSACLQVPHGYTRGGISVRGDVTGAHVLHPAVACCVLNDVYREACARMLAVSGVYVTAEDGFEEDTWASTGVEYSVAVDSGLAPRSSTSSCSPSSRSRRSRGRCGRVSTYAGWAMPEAERTCRECPVDDASGVVAHA